ncbi:two-component sensor histidine kinase [Pseudohalocynthiibacter aestuariivivens]|nr:two-component sensor histidine kinase [Pseudohalocynthiibacter aestuariivivens]
MKTRTQSIPRQLTIRRQHFLWLGLVILGVAALAFVQDRLHLSELERESAALHRAASQRAGQHDAHLTALSAIAVAGEGQRSDLFLGVAATISRFYPRIDEVHLVPVDPSRNSVSTVPLGPEGSELIRAAALGSTGAPVLLPHPTRDGFYLLVKRSPNNDTATNALALGIDAGQLLAGDGEFWSGENAGLRLVLPDGHILIGTGETGRAQYSRPLGSASQPLLLETTARFGILDLLPPLRVIGVTVAISLLYLIALTGLRQRRRTRAAEREAELRTMEAQLSHATRVNAMGEMASGMAHELTQPLTAILAQSQAGLRLLARGETDALGPVFQDTVAQGKRASAILERLRNWSRPQRASIKRFDLRDVLKNVQALLAPEVLRRDVELGFDIQPQAVMVQADQVEMEQVIYNVVRNSFDALDGVQGGQVDVAVILSAENVVLEMTDNGPGVDVNIRPQLFTPFLTTREDGTGLGLALSQRLVERAGGEISYVPTPSGATFRVVLPLAETQREATQ